MPYAAPSPSTAGIPSAPPDQAPAVAPPVPGASTTVTLTNPPPTNPPPTNPSPTDPLPLNAPTANPSERDPTIAPGPTIPPPAPRPKILVVDDEPDVRDSTAQLLEALGCDVVTTSDPDAILAIVARERPALMLQDLKMPGLNIAGLVASLRADEASADMPLVFFSANADLATTAARYDAWGYLPKPFRPEELARLLENVLHGRGGAIPLTISDRDIQREVRTVFHDYWNLVAALNNYAVIARRTPGMPPAATTALLRLEEVLLKLEAKTDRLRAYVLAVADAAPAPAGQRAEPAQADRRDAGARLPPGRQEPPRTLDPRFSGARMSAATKSANERPPRSPARAA